MAKFFQTALERAKGFEGFSATPYICPAGKRTIGYGLNLERGDFSNAVTRALGGCMVRAVANGNGVTASWSGLVMAENEAEYLLRKDLVYHWSLLVKEQPFVKDLCENAQLVLLDMAFNMGVNGLLGFKRMFKKLKRGDWLGVEQELMDSKWATQVGDRAEDNRRLIEGLTPRDLSIEQRLGRLESHIGGAVF